MAMIKHWPKVSVFFGSINSFKVIVDSAILGGTAKYFSSVPVLNVAYRYCLRGTQWFCHMANSSILNKERKNK